jgi:hypothetical protein
MTHAKDEALKLALDALVYASSYCDTYDAIDAIKQALNDATHLAAPVQEEDLYDLAVKADNGGQP